CCNASQGAAGQTGSQICSLNFGAAGICVCNEAAGYTPCSGPLQGPTGQGCCSPDQVCCQGICTDVFHCCGGVFCGAAGAVCQPGPGKDDAEQFKNGHCICTPAGGMPICLAGAGHVPNQNYCCDAPGQACNPAGLHPCICTIDGVPGLACLNANA